MPLLVNRYIFSLAPSLAPFFLRPLLWPVCSLLDAKIVAEPLTASLKYVRTLCFLYSDISILTTTEG
jgi:hypothetical protein